MNCGTLETFIKALLVLSQFTLKKSAHPTIKSPPSMTNIPNHLYQCNFFLRKILEAKPVKIITDPRNIW